MMSRIARDANGQQQGPGEEAATLDGPDVVALGNEPDQPQEVTVHATAAPRGSPASARTNISARLGASMANRST